MIRDKIKDCWKDFAFVEYFSIEDASKVMLFIKDDPLRIKIQGRSINVTYSKLKKGETFERVRPIPDYFPPSQNPLTNLFYSSYKVNAESKPVEDIIVKRIELEKKDEPKKELIQNKPKETKPLTEAEKIKFELRKWEREQLRREKITQEINQFDIPDEENCLKKPQPFWICVSCKRKFLNEKHIKLHFDKSELHKSNKMKSLAN